MTETLRRYTPDSPSWAPPSDEYVTLDQARELLLELKELESLQETMPAYYEAQAIKIIRQISPQDFGALLAETQFKMISDAVSDFFKNRE